MSQVKRFDWVTCPDSPIVGLVKRVARDGSWADVDWRTHTKRMQTRVLVVQTTLPFPDGWTVTDVTREREVAGQ